VNRAADVSLASLALALTSPVLALAALAGIGIARYYVLVTWATVASLVNYLRTGVPPVWEKAEGTR